MPQIVRYIDDIAAERGAPVLLLRFGSLGSIMSPTIRRKRQKVFSRLDQEGIGYEPCGAPRDSGWMSYLGDLALEVPYDPGEAAYETVRAMFEDDTGERLDPEVALCLFVP